MTDAEIHVVLVKARNLIERGGWQQSFGYGQGPHCAVSAIHACGGGRSHDPGTPVGALAAVIGCYATGPGVGLWNDAPGRTKEEVLVTFDKAIVATSPSPCDPTWSDLTEDIERESVHA